MIELTVTQKDGWKLKYVLKDGDYTIGRADDNDILLKGKEVSRHHALLRVRGEEISLQDRNSGNGTFVNGEKISFRILKGEEDILIYPYSLKVVLLDKGEGSTQLQEDESPTFPGVREGEQVPVSRPPTPHLPRGSTPAEIPFGVKARAEVLFTKGEWIGKRFQINNYPFVLGSAEGCNIVFKDKNVSKKHCSIEYRNGRFFIEDLGSSDGIHIGGRRVFSQELQHGDRVGLGESEFIFLTIKREGKVMGEAIGMELREMGKPTEYREFERVESEGKKPLAEPIPKRSGITPEGSAFDTSKTPADTIPPTLTAEITKTKTTPAASIELSLPGVEGKKGAIFGRLMRGRAPLYLGAAGVTLFLVLIIAFFGKVSSNRPTPSQVSPPEKELSEEELMKKKAVEDYLKRGKEAFSKKDFDTALKEFNIVLKKLDPENVEVKRLIYLTSEYIVVDRIEKEVMKLSALEKEKRETKENSLKKGQELLAKGESVNIASAPQSTLLRARQELQQAIESFKTVLKVDPENRMAKDGIDRAQKKITYINKMVVGEKKRSFVNRIENLYKEGLQAKKGGNYLKAIKNFEEILKLDSKGESSYYYPAKEEAEACKAYLRNEAREHFVTAKNYMKTENYLNARIELQKAVKIDPYYTEAKNELSRVEEELLKRGKMIFSQAQVYEKIDQLPTALKLYERVLDYIPEKTNDYHIQASQKIEDIKRKIGR